jgi:hypothetical protein
MLAIGFDPFFDSNFDFTASFRDLERQVFPNRNGETRTARVGNKQLARQTSSNLEC